MPFSLLETQAIFFFSFENEMRYLSTTQDAAMYQFSAVVGMTIRITVNIKGLKHVSI